MPAPVITSSVNKAAVSTATPGATASLVSGGVNRALYCAVLMSDGSPGGVTSVTWSGGGGETLTSIYDSGVVQSFLRLHIYRRIAPTAATGALTPVLAAATSEIGIFGWAVEDVDQTTPNGTIAAVNGAGSGNAASGTIASATGETIIDVIGRFVNGAMTVDPASIGTGQTILSQNSANALFQFGSSTRAGATTPSTVWGINGYGTVSNWQYVMAALSLKPVSAGGGGNVIQPAGRSATNGGMQGLTGGMARAIHQFHERLHGRRIFLMGA